MSLLKLMIVLLLAFASVTSAFAGSIDDADSAIERGDYGAAINILFPAAQAGFPEAQCKIALLYYYRTQFFGEAIYWFRKAAEQDYAEAQNCLAVIYESGEGVTRDPEKAEMWYRKAAEQGYEPLGLMQYDYGRPKDSSEIAKEVVKAAEEGDAQYQFNLGLMYETGEGVPQDDLQAAYWYRKAAEQGFVYAQYVLGRMYDSGKGVPQDDSQAAHWYRKAAEQGDAHAQYSLGVYYYNGKGVRKDKKEAVRWYHKAAERSYELEIKYP